MMTKHANRVLPALTLHLFILLPLNFAEPLLAHEGSRPNIVLILCDDLGYADVGFNGSPDIRTPHLDALAAGGTVCTSAYVVHPFCGPSRMGLMAGRYPHKFGAPFNLPPYGMGYEEYNHMGIPVSETLISTTLQKAGYFTGAVGKWHLGFDAPFHPNNRGFDEFYGFLGGGHMYFPERYAPIYKRQVAAGKTIFNEYQTPLEHNGKQVDETEYMTDALSREAVRFVKQASEKQNPFFLYVAYNAPHMPLEAKEEDLNRYAHIKNDKRRIYAAMVHAVDRGVGNIVDALKQTNSLDNTLLVFLSDNGGKIGGGSNNMPLKQGKGSVCEGGFRVPMLFHWPNHVPSATRYPHPVSAIDFYPTFAALAGADVPTTQQLDGRNISADFVAGRNARDNQDIFAMRFYAAFGNVGVRRNQWKATCIGKRWELFNIEEDIAETTDISDQHPDVLKSMIAAAKNWTESHTQPQWFDNPPAGKRWTENGMPNYQSLFNNK